MRKTSIKIILCTSLANHQKHSIVAQNDLKVVIVLNKPGLKPASTLFLSKPYPIYLPLV